ncbi:CDP-diacylglycerol--glycerol-3-phosphate 3-phosphatidyltransferase [Desulfurobacterium atlanticum]|uniref:CDP-diacylglycerol--glycerol-3-phosphate 3-phosphatidyltransferase n=1 Tax=Desulfurobacterium atlanticum TaxID=240169 RepID=A0A238YXH4_9BACT|nr:CDP-diacylglycerol--glycerol-3-phosphate 3-phosphatidyltransferase [Desulfurobacterium atlanticum]SNR75323.1 CDP-diacylglycerol--glycerol-3-phosphate 3-phosphatidyltransferase/cardiolipin synthase [Desulfurobacterium atlanticum]
MSAIPNILTILRIIFIPFIVFFIIEGMYFISIILFVISAFTDFLDGYLARKMRSVSNFGKLFDPVADKILTSSVLIALSYKHLCDPYSVTAIVAREEAVTGLRAIAASKGIVLPAGNLGKIKTVLLMVSIITLLSGFLKLGGYLLLFSAAVAVYSGVLYFYHFFKSVEE